MTQVEVAFAGLLAMALGAACNDDADTTLLVEVGGGSATAPGADEPLDAATDDTSSDPGWIHAPCSYVPYIDVGDLYGSWSGPQAIIDDFERAVADSCEIAGRGGHWSQADPSLPLSFGPGVSSSSLRSLLMTEGLALSFPRAGETLSSFDASSYDALRFFLHNPGSSPSTVNLVVAVAGSDGCSGAAPSRECLDLYTTTVTAAPGTTEQRVSWGAFQFTGPALQPASPQAGTIKHLYEVQFSGSGLYLDDLAFISGPCGCGTACATECCGDGQCTFSEYQPGPPANTTLADRWGVASRTARASPAAVPPRISAAKCPCPSAEIRRS